MRPVLFQSSDKNITLLDIPQSIVQAQRLPSPSLTLLSSAALEQPWPSQEPKSERARRSLEGSQPAVENDYKEYIRSALEAVRDVYPGPFCLPRYVSDTSRTGLKRRASRSLDPDAKWKVEAAEASDPDAWSDGSGNVLKLTGEPSATPGWSEANTTSIQEVSRRLVTNTSSTALRLHVIHEASTYCIPPSSSFFLAHCTESRALHQAVAKYSAESGANPTFDVVVLDPPWPNRSVKHSKGKGTHHYNVSSNIWELRQLLFGMEIGTMISKGGVVAVWITNNAAARDLVLSQEDGLFASWDVELIEEWIWLKVTSRGEPVLPVDSLWRKPYEVLLVGKKPITNEATINAIRKRVIVAVPDLHSRKPNLKMLLQDQFVLPEDYRGLEVFARNLTSGWCAWGNEVLKFNDSQHWSRIGGGKDGPAGHDEGGAEHAS